MNNTIATPLDAAWFLRPARYLNPKGLPSMGVIEAGLNPGTSKHRL